MVVRALGGIRVGGRSGTSVAHRAVARVPAPLVGPRREEREGRCAGGQPTDGQRVPTLEGGTGAAVGHIEAHQPGLGNVIADGGAVRGHGGVVAASRVLGALLAHRREPLIGDHLVGRDVAARRDLVGEPAALDGQACLAVALFGVGVDLLHGVTLLLGKDKGILAHKLAFSRPEEAVVAHRILHLKRLELLRLGAIEGPAVGAGALHARSLPLLEVARVARELGTEEVRRLTARLHATRHANLHHPGGNRLDGHIHRLERGTADRIDAPSDDGPRETGFHCGRLRGSHAQAALHHVAQGGSLHTRRVNPRALQGSRKGNRSQIDGTELRQVAIKAPDRRSRRRADEDLFLQNEMHCSSILTNGDRHSGPSPRAFRALLRT